MYADQQQSTYTTRHYIYDPQSSSTHQGNMLFDQTRPSQSSTYNDNYQSTVSTNDFNEGSNFRQQQSTINPAASNAARYPSTTNNHSRSNSTGSVGRGSIEKTNKMSSENPFHDPSRSYEQHQPARTVSSITTQPKTSGGINKSLNLSDENPFHAIYGGYHYPSQVDSSKRITNQGTAIRSTDNKSLNLSDENPFYSTYERYHYPSQIDPQKRITEIPKKPGPLIPINDLPDNNPFGNYRPSLIREYSAGLVGNGSNSFSTSIADWTRNNPAPLSYRPIQVQRPPPEFYSQNDSPKTSSYIPPASPPRTQRQVSPAASLTRKSSLPQKSTSSTPLDKNSLNMSPDNPFADTYGRYHYPSSDEIKTQKRTIERNARLPEQQPIHENRTKQPTNPITEYPDTEKKDISTSKGNSKFARFDVTL